MKCLFIVLVACLVTSTTNLFGQNGCVCKQYVEVFKLYRAAKDDGDIKRAEAIAEGLSHDAIPFCRTLGLDLLANIKINASDMQTGLALIEKEKALLDSLKCSAESYMEYFISKSYYHYTQDEYDSSIANSIKALKIAEQTTDVARQIALRLGIGSAFYHSGQPLKKLEYAQSIIPLVAKITDPSLQCQYYVYLCDSYFSHYVEIDKNKAFLDSAKFYNLKAMQIAKRSSNSRFLFYCYQWLEKIHREENGAPTKGLVYVDSALHFGKGALNHEELSALLIDKAEFLALAGNKSLALAIMDSALYHSARHPQKSIYASQLIDASNLFSKLGDPKKALLLYQQGDAILDSIKSIDNSRTINELEQKYGKEKNEKTIVELSQERKINQLQIRLLIFGVLIALVAIALIVFVYRLSLLRQQQQAIESKYKLDQALINPHFLSNALVSIQSFMLENNAQQASNYLSKFSRMMRQLLEFSREDLITIEQEIDLIRNYLDIQKLRFKSKFEYTIDVDQVLAIADARISPMFTQPFIENAVEHGISQLEAGKINIVLRQQHNRLHIQIEDNGPGISKSSGSTGSLSTTIIQERIHLLNKSGKEQISLSIGRGKKGTGTLVQLYLPISS